jgi:hypothetical protein
MRQISLKPHDAVLAIKLALHHGRKFTFAELASALSISASEAHASTKRLKLAGMLLKNEEGLSAVRPAVREFVIHGLKYAFPAVLGPISRGIPTGAAGPTLSQVLSPSSDGPLVWPQASGTTRGPSICPLYERASDAASRDLALYDVLTLIDALRSGDARDRELATAELLKRLA